MTVICFTAMASSVLAEFTFDATVPLYPKVEAAISKAQSWLAKGQQSNGSWSRNNGKNAMAAVALMVNGTTPGKGKYGSQVSKAINYIISSQQSNGFLAGDEQGPMYQHALATLALAEAYGMTMNPDIRAALTKAVDLIVETQDYGGGWRYQPKMEPGDLSVTVMQVMALRACAEFGVYVPEETITHAITFIKACFKENAGGFSYLPSNDEINFNRAAAGVVCLQSVGLHTDPMIPPVIKTISKLAFDEKREKEWFWYGHYYASVALYHHGGEAWKAYYPVICEKILADWSGRDGHYWEVIDTAWAVLVMGVPYRYLPIYQR